MFVPGKPTGTFITSSTAWTKVLLPADSHLRKRKAIFWMFNLVNLRRTCSFFVLVDLRRRCSCLGLGSGGSVRDDREGDNC